MNQDYTKIKTSDLAFQLITEQLSTEEKLLIYKVIKEREYDVPASNEKVERKKVIKNLQKPAQKEPAKGSKSHKILELLKSGKQPKEIIEAFKKKKEIIYPSEIYRIVRVYNIETEK